MQIAATTPQECKIKIIELMRNQAIMYSSQVRIAIRKRVQQEAVAKSDCLRALADYLETEIKIV